MEIWVDADACPKLIKEILFRVAKRTKIVVTFVSNQVLQLPTFPFIKMKQVAQGFDVADHYIIQNVKNGDLVITSDIPLADAIVAKGAVGLSPRGQLFSQQNIKQHLSIRNFHDELRSSGIQTGGVAKLHQREVQEFANNLDRYLQSHHSHG